jgi:ABC-type transport system substrate-binding protein
MGVRLVRNEVYFGRKPFLEAIEFSPYFTSDHFMDREVDIIPYLSESFSRTDCQVVEDSQFELVFLVMSVHLAPLNKSEIRRALAFGINKENIARVAFSLDANSYVLDNYIPPKLPGFFPLEGKKRYDRDKAWQILRDQGFSYDREFPPLNFFLPADRTELFEKVYGGLKKELEPLGIELKVKRYRSLQEVRASREPYLLLIDSILDFPDPEDIIVPCYYSKGRFNLANYSNPNLDKLVEEALVERGASRRTELFRQIEKILMVDVPTIPLFSHQRRLAVQPYVRGLKAHPLGIAYSDMKEVWLDK